MSILIYETCKYIINFNLELKKLVIIFLLQINEMLVLLLEIEMGPSQIF